MGDHSCSDRGETVTEVETSIALEIDRYLRTGDSDPLHGAWTGGDLIERAKKARDDLRGALLAEVHCRCTGAATPSLPPPEAIAALTRQKT